MKRGLPPLRGRSREELDTVLAGFSVPAIVHVESLAGGSTNANYVVTTRAGGVRYVLRENQRNPHGARIEFQVAFQRHLLDAGYPTPELVPARDQSHVVNAFDSTWTLSPFVPGTHFDYERSGQVVEAAVRLGEFHEIGSSFPRRTVEPGGRLPTIEWCVDPERHIEDLRRVLDGYDADDDIARLADLVRTVTSDVDAARVPRLPVRLVHGDYHGVNTIFQGDRLVALLDFDAVRTGSRAEDVARGMFAFGRERRGSATIRPDVARRFLGAYRERFPLTPAELAVLPACAALYWAQDAPRSERFIKLGVDPTIELRERLPLVEALVRQGDLIRRIVESV